MGSYGRMGTFRLPWDRKLLAMLPAKPKEEAFVYTQVDSMQSMHRMANGLRAGKSVSLGRRIK
jgi:hypothetical protein